MHRQVAVAFVLVGTLAIAAPVTAAPKSGPLQQYKHIVVVYEENHSFDNLYGMWGNVNGQHIVGLSDADAAHTTQVDQSGTAYSCLLQTDVNLRTTVQSYPGSASGPLSQTCTQSVTLGDGTVAPISSHFGNAPYNIDTYIPASAQTCPDVNHLFSFTNGILAPNGLPGGCTRDLVHRFYQEQYQLNGGQQNRYVSGSDSSGMTMGYYNTTNLPIYQYLHANGAPNYVIADHFFQAAFGGSFLNHQFLIAAAAPLFPTAAHSVLNSDGMPRSTTGCTSGAYPLYASSTCTSDQPDTQACGQPTTQAAFLCGDYAVNTVNPFYQPTSSFGPQLPPINDLTTPMNIGDLMSDAGVSWDYYGGGWDNAAGVTNGRGYTNQTNGTPGGSCSDPNSSPAAADGTGAHGWPYCPDKSYQAHHYPFAYFARYAPGQPGRAHLQDEQDFLYAAHNGSLPAVSFVKPLGNENEHPGYSSEPNGSDHLVDLINAVMNGPEAGNTLILVTYDEFGGQWDHVPPPGQGNNVAAHDAFGPGTRIPAILIGRSLTKSGVDHTYYDTLSIMRTIEAQWNLPNLGLRDAQVNDLGNMLTAARPH